MISLALIEGREELAVVFYLGFAGLFRASELTGMRLDQISLVSSRVCIKSLTESKTAVRMANAESVIIKDTSLIEILGCESALDCLVTDYLTVRMVR